MSDEADSDIRSCDGCTACCYTHAVGEIEKYEFTTCTDCVSGGCRIYESRPRACGAFYCAWAVNDIGTDDERPDKVGVVCSSLFVRFTKNDPPAIMMIEAWPGALAEPPAQALLARVLASGTAVHTAERNAHPRYQYHVLRSTMEAYGQMLEKKYYKVIWHED